MGWLAPPLLGVVGGDCRCRAGVLVYAARALPKQFKEHEGTNPSSHLASDKLKAIPFTPILRLLKNKQRKSRSEVTAVIATWQQLYDRQRAEVLKWPERIGTRLSRCGGKAEIRRRNSRKFRDLYRDYAETIFPQLPKMIGARSMEAGSAAVAVHAIEARTMMRQPTRQAKPPRRSGDRPERTVEEEISSATGSTSKRFAISCMFESVAFVAPRLGHARELVGLSYALRSNRRHEQAAGADRQSNAAVREIESLEVGRPAAEQSLGTQDRMWTIR